MKASSILPKTDPIYLACSNNLALIYKTSGKYEKAIPIYESVYIAYKETIGDDHKSTMILKHNLAASYKAMGSPDKAISLLKSLPELSSETMQFYILKASCYKDVNSIEKAKEIVLEAENYIQLTYGKGNVISVNLLNCKGLVYKQSKEYEIAEKAFKE